MRAKHEEFREKITRAKEMQAERQMGDAYHHLVTVFDDLGEVPDVRMAGVRARHAKDMVDAAIKLAGQRAPRKYGSRVEVEHSADESLSAQLDAMSARLGEDL